MSDLIDTTEMYLRTIFELEEEGVPTMRARIAERLGQSGPTVSQTVARMKRDGLLELATDRHIVLTDEGRAIATRVMRKHRLAECLLVDVIGLDWADVHTEACRWEHVMSEAVERRLLEILDHPTVSPYGNPIPGLAELDPALTPTSELSNLTTLGSLREGASARIARIGETLQTESETMSQLWERGMRPGASVTMKSSSEEGEIVVDAGGTEIRLSAHDAAHIAVIREP